MRVGHQRIAGCLPRARTTTSIRALVRWAVPSVGAANEEATTVRYRLLRHVAPALVLVVLVADGVGAWVDREFIDAPIAASGDDVYVTWASQRSGDWEVLLRASHDAGKTFEDTINLSESPGVNSFQPDIAVWGDLVSIAFHDARSGEDGVYVRISTDKGRTFGPLIRIPGAGSEAHPPPLIDVGEPLAESEEDTRIAISGRSVYVVSWDRTAGNWAVTLSASHDAGRSFGPTVNVSESPDTRSDRARLVAEGDNVYLSWWETTADLRQEPVMRVSNDRGTSFGPILRLEADGAIGDDTR
jgi:hypothetical protein